MTIEDILSEEEIESVTLMIRNNTPYNTIRADFKRLSRKEIPVFKAFYDRVRKGNYASFGFKDEAYYTTEDIDELYPQYNWKDLSHAEKSWYRIRVKNGIKQKLWS